MNVSNVSAWEIDEFSSIERDVNVREFIPSPTDAQIAAQARLVAVLNPDMAPRTAVAVIEEYITTEIARNRKSGKLFAAIMRIAFGKDDDVSIGHHLSFQPHGDIDSLNEVPSADTLIFDHAVMTAVFGDNAVRVMQHICSFPANKRDDELQRLFDTRDNLPPVL